MSVIIKPDDDTLWLAQDGQITEVPDDVLQLHPDGWFTPECDHITLPSALAPGEINQLSLQSIATIEARVKW